MTAPGDLSTDPTLLPSPLSVDPPDIRSSKEDLRQTKLQECWDKSIAKYMDLPDGYHSVHVLVVKWHDDIDQLNVRDEVDDLKNLFKNTFNYEVTEVQLNGSKCQLQLSEAMIKWALAHDRQDNLLIVYYAGHGIYDRSNKILEFSPTNEIDSVPKVNWNRAERFLIDDVESDVLTIMDCCYASDLLRNVPEVGRTFEMLAASHIGETTPQPGEDSFTRCVIQHLKQLAVESSHSFFTTRDILERLQRDRPDQAPALWRRISGNSRHIRLSRLKPLCDRPPKRNSELSHHERFLTLGFALKNEALCQKHIEHLTRTLPQVFRDAGAPLVDIKWLGCRKVGMPSFKELADIVMKNRDHFTRLSPVSDKKRDGEEANLEEGGNKKPKLAKLETGRDAGKAVPSFLSP